MRTTIKVILILCLLTVFDCTHYGNSKSAVIYLMPNDKSQTITIFSNYITNRRIIALGKHRDIPEDNIILLDISKVPKLADEIGVCWNKKGHNWEVVNDKAIVLENKLDTTKYVFREKWFVDEFGIPRGSYYWEDNCFTIGVASHYEPRPQGNGYIERGLKNNPKGIN